MQQARDTARLQTDSAKFKKMILLLRAYLDISDRTDLKCMTVLLNKESVVVVFFFLIKSCSHQRSIAGVVCVDRTGSGGVHVAEQTLDLPQRDPSSPVRHLGIHNVMIYTHLASP